MILLNLRMSETQKLSIDDMAKTLGINSSVLMRAVLYEGLAQVKTRSAKNIKESADHLKLLDAKAKL